MQLNSMKMFSSPSQPKWTTVAIRSVAGKTVMKRVKTRRSRRTRLSKCVSGQAKTVG